MTLPKIESLKNVDRYLMVLDLLPDMHVWAKDKNGCFVYGNRLFFERFGFKTLQSLLGKNDVDLAPSKMATQYQSDDAIVLAGGKLVDRLEQIRKSGEGPEWFLTSKWPIVDFGDCVIGSLGISRHLNKDKDKEVECRELQLPVDYIDRNFDSDISVKLIAQAANLSISALERRFKRHFNKTPHQYLNEVRLERARQLLTTTNKKIGVIAAETGFTDHSHFTKGFAQFYDTTPSKMRQKIASQQ